MLYFSIIRLRQGQETFLRNIQTGSAAHPASYSISSGVSSGVRADRGVMFITPNHVVLRLIMTGSTVSIPTLRMP